MKFRKNKRFLEDLFEKEYFYKHDNHSKRKKVYECKNGTEIFIVYPGYKATKDNYDYRVDIKKESKEIPLSHCNIITDIYNKCINNHIDKVKFKYLLINVFKEGRFDLEKYDEFSNYRNDNAPSKNLLDIIDKAHRTKQFNREGNVWDLNFEELFFSIGWIVIQEDLNYPIEDGYEGRKMPLCRYIETIYCTEFNDHEIDEVIERTVVHNRRPSKWNEINYSFLNDIR